MTILQESLKMLQASIELSHAKIKESFQHLHFPDKEGLDLLLDSCNILTALEHYIEQATLYGLDLGRLLRLADIHKALPSNLEAS